MEKRAIMQIQRDVFERDRLFMLADADRHIDLLIRVNTVAAWRPSMKPVKSLKLVA